jgi:hypothetical protein
MEAAPEEDEPNEPDSAAAAASGHSKICMAIQKVFIFFIAFNQHY